jgi:hypothetical protein
VPDKRWIEPWELSGAAKLKRGTCRQILYQLFHHDDAVFRRLSGKSWYGTAGYEYALKIEYFGLGLGEPDINEYYHWDVVDTQQLSTSTALP